MPAEDIRRRLANDFDLYPELASKAMSKPISIASTSSADSSAAHVEREKNRTKSIVISSDDESDEDFNSEKEVVEIGSRPQVERHMPLQRIDNSKVLQHPQPARANPLPASQLHSLKPAQPIPPPANRYVAIPPPQAARVVKPGQSIPIPSNSRPQLQPQDQYRDNIFAQGDMNYVSPAETEKALRELMTGGMNENLETEVDMEDAIVKGFKDGITLLPHQVLGRAWMRDREDLSMKRTGGILADDMGLGKTIQTLARIVEGRAKKSDKEDGWSATNLVVCPLALVGQWASEIEKMTTALKVIKHQGTSRTSDENVLMRSHIVITTYDTLKSEFEAFSGSAKNEGDPKPKTKKKTVVDSDDDSESAETFGRTVVAKKRSKAPKKCALFKVKWWRIILDEAHNIKNQQTKGAKACCELDAKFRWCLTGTPMQNNVTELYSLIKFLRIKPLSNWDVFNEQIGKPVHNGRGAGTAMKRLQVVLKAIMLRRRKDQLLNGKKLIELPLRTITVVSCPFDSSEQAFYSALENKMEDVVEKLMDKGANSYISMLVLLLRLRQACNHPVLVAKDYKKDLEAIEPKSVAKGGDDKDPDADDLANAFEQLGVTRKCLMCTTELNPKNVGSGEWKTHCNTCVPLAIEAKRAEHDRPSSAKIRMVIKLLRDIEQRSGEEKTIIFSQFTSMLDLLQPFLQEEGIQYVRYDGSMSTDNREKSLEKIRESKTIRVILISFKAGSTGLNLTACNNVILVDLWWNPALEDQAFDRAHRFGQLRDVNIFKLKIDDSVEDRILMLQDKKRALAAAALSGDKIKNSKLGMDDLLALFRPGARDEDEENIL